MIVVVIGFHKHGIIIDSMRQSSVHHCHCEERSDVAIRFPLVQTNSTEMLKKSQPLGNGLPRQCAHWLAMTVVVGTLVEPSYILR